MFHGDIGNLLSYERRIVLHCLKRFSDDGVSLVEGCPEGFYFVIAFLFVVLVLLVESFLLYFDAVLIFSFC